MQAFPSDAFDQLRRPAVDQPVARAPFAGRAVADQTFGRVQPNPVRGNRTLAREGVDFEALLVQVFAEELHRFFRAAQAQLVAVVDDFDFSFQVHVF